MPDPAQDQAQRNRDLELQRSREVIAKAWGTPELRPGLRKIVKETLPDLRLPDDDFDAISAPLRAENEALKKQFSDLMASLAKRDEEAAARDKERQDADYATRLQDARNRFALSPEGFDKMVAHMKAT